MSNYPAKSQSVSGNLFVGSPGAVQARDNDAMRQLRRSVLFVANGSHPAKSPVGAAPSAAMPLLRSFVVCRSLSTKMPPRWGWERRPSPLTQGLRATAIEPSYGARVNVLPRPARNERGEGWGEGQSNKNAPPLPVPLLPLRGERGKLTVFPLGHCLIQTLWATAIESGAAPASDKDAMRQLRRNGLFVAKRSHPTKNRVRAASSPANPPLP